MKPLSEAPLVVDGLVGDMPIGLIALAPHEKKTLQFSANYFSKLRSELIIDVPEGAQLTIEGFVRLESGSSLEYVCIIRGRGRVITRQRLEIAADAICIRRYVGDLSGEAVCEIDDDVHLVGEGARIVTDVRHVLRDGARSTVRGRIVVQKEAVRSDANMQLHHLLLSEGAFAASIPELSVLTDDVVCRHGASISRPSHVMMTYLESRGLAVSEAEHVLAEAFLCPVK